METIDNYLNSIQSTDGNQRVRRAVSRIGLSFLIIVALLAIAAVGSYVFLDQTTSVPLTSNNSSAGCTVSYPNGVGIDSDFLVNEGSTLTLCVRFFYYSSQIETINSTDYIAITAATNSSQGYGSGNADGNFNIVANPSNFQIGGNSDLNEGVTVTYQIQPHSGTKGAYMMLGPGWSIPSDEECNPTYLLTVGNGSPSYVQEGGCITVTMNMTHTYDGMSFSCPELYTCTEVIGSSNETLN